MDVSAEHVTEVIDHLFRHESGKMVSVLTRVFGAGHLEMAEDVVQDALMAALRQWPFHGVPQNPSGWLYRVARNRALDIIRREKHHVQFNPELSLLLESEWSAASTLHSLFEEDQIKDEQLRMMFLCCHPSLPEESQIALTLKTLCGFSVLETAKALLTTVPNVNKRLFRAKQTFRKQHIGFEIPSERDLAQRLDIVLTVVYLLFNEGHNAAEDDQLIRKDICAEAIRLGQLLLDHPFGRVPKTYALLALLCFQASRFDARLNKEGRIILLQEQDRTRWHAELISLGSSYLNQSSYGNEISEYHFEAAIAACHCLAKSFEETNWDEILSLYDGLIGMKPSPITKLNRAIVIAQIYGASKGIEELKLVEDLDSYHLYHSTLGELYSRLSQADAAKRHWRKALQLTHSKAEKNFISEKLQAVGKS